MTTKLCKECGEVNNIRAVASVYINKLIHLSTTDTYFFCLVCVGS